MFCFLFFSFFQGMPGENEKQPGQAPEQIPPSWRQYARERSEHPASARGDGRRVERFKALGGEVSRGHGSGRAGIFVFRDGATAPRMPCVHCTYFPKSSKSIYPLAQSGF